jgi:hypothetical protein
MWRLATRHTSYQDSKIAVDLRDIAEAIQRHKRVAVVDFEAERALQNARATRGHQYSRESHDSRFAAGAPKFAIEAASTPECTNRARDASQRRRVHSGQRGQILSLVSERRLR